MSLWLVHLYPALVQEPDVFRPEKWLEPGSDALKKAPVGFSRGNRSCLTKNLAQAEIVYNLALLVRRWAGEED